MANRPTLLLADEPTGALDSGGAAEVLDLFRRLHDGGQTILMVTHNREVAVGAERVVRMRDGRVVDSGVDRAVTESDDAGEFDPRRPVEPAWVDALTGLAPGWPPTDAGSRPVARSATSGRARAVNDRPGRRARLALFVAGLLVAVRSSCSTAVVARCRVARVSRRTRGLAVLAGMAAGASAQARRSCTR